MFYRTSSPLGPLPKKEMSKWGRTTLLRLEEHDYGWAKQINNTLTNWNLETDWHVIQEMSVGEWKRRVDAAAEEQNLCRLKKECLSKNRNETKQKTKTKYLEEVLNDKNYKREPSPLIHQNQKLITTRALNHGVNKNGRHVQFAAVSSIFGLD